MDDCIELLITEQDLENHKRLDQYLSKNISNYSRTFIKNLFLAGNIETTDSKKLELKKMPPLGTKIIISIPPPVPTDTIAQNLPLDILFEDEHLIIVNKAAGMVTHPAPGNYSGTLVNAILYHCPDLKGIGNELRPGIVHRLDKGTSGVMVVAKTQQCHEKLVMLFSKHDINRIYHAISFKYPIKKVGSITTLIGRHKTNRKKMDITTKNGKSATTHYKTVKSYDKFSLIQLKLETGRTHQIRVHLSRVLNTPILCDETYGNPNQQIKHFSGKIKTLLQNYKYPLLHASTLGFIHPITNKSIEFNTDLPDIFTQILNLSDNNSN